jgi:hypothetical protein
MPPDETKAGAMEARAGGSRDHDKDRKRLEHLQLLAELDPELQLNGMRDLRLAVQHGRIAELRTQRDLEHAFSQSRIVVVDEQLRIAATKARGRQYLSLLLFGLLIPVAALVAGVLYSGSLADDVALWATAGTVFFMSYAAIIIFAATSLGSLAEMIQLIRMQFQSAEQTSPVTTTGSSSTLSFDELRNKYSKDG